MINCYRDSVWELMSLWTCAGIALLATALVINWQLGLVMLACVPFIVGSVAILSKLMSGSAQEGADFYEKAGGVATEVISSHHETLLA